MQRVLHDVAETSALIKAKKRLFLAGDEGLLRQLPQGDWIGGTIPYLLGEEGGLTTREKIHVTEVGAEAVAAQIKVYGPEDLAGLYTDAPANSWIALNLPGLTEIHSQFALEAPNLAGFGSRPLIGWIAGIHLDDLGQVTPKVFDGTSGEAYEDKGVAMQVTLPDHLAADIEILNIFEPGGGDTIEFLEDGFAASKALVNGEEVDFAAYCEEQGLDQRLPLVASYCGAMVNVSFQAVNAAEGRVDFYAPVFRNVEYRHAAAVGDYEQEFLSRVPKDTGAAPYACNCVLNYLHSKLDGARTGELTGPFTFGEIAYQLLNQTLVYLTINEV